MRNAFLAGASAVALVLGACSMFQSRTGSSSGAAASGASTANGAPVLDLAPEPGDDDIGRERVRSESPP